MNKFVPVPGFEEYLFNKNGKVLSKMNNGRILHICYGKNYASVKLRDQHRNIHRLLALAFIPNPHGYPMINHKDGNKHNFSLDNLEWCTIYQNNEHAQRTGLLVNGQQVHTNVLDEIQVLTIRQCVKDGMRTKPLADYFKVHKSTIDAIAAGRNWKHICTYPIERDRYKDGDRNSKLTIIQVMVIKEALLANHKQIRIAEYFKVNDVTIHAIKHGRSWKHISI